MRFSFFCIVFVLFCFSSLKISFYACYRDFFFPTRFLLRYHLFFFFFSLSSTLPFLFIRIGIMSAFVLVLCSICFLLLIRSFLTSRLYACFAGAGLLHTIFPVFVVKYLRRFIFPTQHCRFYRIS